jgi:hypothetical protein
MRGTRKVSGWSGAPEGDAQAGGGRSQWRTQSKRLRRRDLEARAEDAWSRGARCFWVLFRDQWRKEEASKKFMLWSLKFSIYYFRCKT